MFSKKLKVGISAFFVFTFLNEPQAASPTRFNQDVIINGNLTTSGNTTTGALSLSLPPNYSSQVVSTSGNISALALTGGVVKFTSSSAKTLTGISSGADGKNIYLMNTGSGALTIAHQSGTESTSANRFINYNGADLVLAQNEGVLSFYDGTQSRWVISGNVGVASSTMTLTNKTLSGNTSSNFINGSGTININSSGTITVPNASDTLVGKSTNDVLTNKTLTSPIVNAPTLKAYTETVNALGNISGSNAVDWSLGNVASMTLTGNTTLTFSNVPASGPLSSLTMIIKQDATGSRTISWPACATWAGGSAPAISTAANKTDIISCSSKDGGTVCYCFTGGIGF